mmetsp:Transcript_12397/g.24057  ORF Transcript_12397/g.24057 Transcript_12397/m.24057 type:complete len:651 (-) Transcript_12397:709-2661(-)
MEESLRASSDEELLVMYKRMQKSHENFSALFEELEVEEKSLRMQNAELQHTLDDMVKSAARLHVTSRQSTALAEAPGRMVKNLMNALSEDHRKSVKVSDHIGDLSALPSNQQTSAAAPSTTETESAHSSSSVTEGTENTIRRASTSNSENDSGFGGGFLLRLTKMANSATALSRSALGPQPPRQHMGHRASAIGHHSEEALVKMEIAAAEERQRRERARRNRGALFGTAGEGDRERERERHRGVTPGGSNGPSAVSTERKRRTTSSSGGVASFGPSENDSEAARVERNRRRGVPETPTVNSSDSRPSQKGTRILDLSQSQRKGVTSQAGKPRWQEAAGGFMKASFNRAVALASSSFQATGHKRGQEEGGGVEASVQVAHGGGDEKGTASCPQRAECEVEDVTPSGRPSVKKVSFTAGVPTFNIGSEDGGSVRGSELNDARPEGGDAEVVPPGDRARGVEEEEEPDRQSEGLDAFWDDDDAIEGNPPLIKLTVELHGGRGTAQVEVRAEDSVKAVAEKFVRERRKLFCDGSLEKAEAHFESFLTKVEDDAETFPISLKASLEEICGTGCLRAPPSPEELLRHLPSSSFSVCTGAEKRQAIMAEEKEGEGRAEDEEWTQVQREDAGAESEEEERNEGVTEVQESESDLLPCN